MTALPPTWTTCHVLHGNSHSFALWTGWRWLSVPDRKELTVPDKWRLA